MTSNEEQVKRAVVDRISSDSAVDASDIGVHVSDGHVVLRGTVPTGAASDSAEADALRVIGVTEVDNQLEVRPPVAEAAPTDGELESRIRAALSESRCTREGPFQVSVNSGVATLTGSVDTLWLKAQIERVASDLKGVTVVSNRLKVMPPDPVSDQEIAQAILDALERSDSINDETVDVRVEDGVVTLSGSAPSDSARRIAHNAAFNTIGVRDLRNKLVVRAS
jgi:osmotically-inducible protein OsmY